MHRSLGGKIPRAQSRKKKIAPAYKQARPCPFPGSVLSLLPKPRREGALRRYRCSLCRLRLSSRKLRRALREKSFFVASLCAAKGADVVI